MNEDQICLELPASYKYLNVVGACISAILERVDGLEAPNVVAYNLQLAIHEACTNIIAHAYADCPVGRIKVSLSLSRNPQQLLIELQDTGCSFDIENVPDPNLEEGQVHGYGIFLMRKLLDEVVYHPQPGNNRWHLAKKL
jgi:serine/threonine-protein kinase RsbW